MIPLHLRVRNFMCYRGDVRPLNFEGIHLACLTGANGHGKSALLDAMTWALWGKARARRDDDLIHLGESEMEVEFAFDLGGTTYRVLRKRDSSKRGSTLLDLQVQSPDPSQDGAFQSIAEPTVRATQAAIIRLLRMDYETFTNSAFLLQGKADAFTTRTPAERKRVLGEILGLSLYDDYEQRAKTRARDRDRQVAELDGALRDIDRELERRPEYEVEVASAESDVAETGASFQAAEAELRALRKQVQVLEQQQARLRDVEGSLAQAQAELAEVQGQVAGRRKRLDLYEETLARRRQVEEGYAELVTAREAEAGWNQRLAQYAQLQEQQRPLERAIEAARGELDRARGRLGERVRELDRTAAGRPEQEGNLAGVAEKVGALAEVQSARERSALQLQALAEESAALQVRNDQSLAEMEALKEKLDLLQRETGEAQCPLCGQNLGESHRDELLEQFQAEGKARADSHRANSARRKAIDGESKRLRAEVRSADGQLAALPGLERQRAQLDQLLAQAEAAAGEVKAARAELAAVEAKMEAGDYAPTERAELERLSAEVEAIGYDRDTHDQSRARAAELAAFEGQSQQLAVAAERVEEERAALQDLDGRQARWREAVAKNEADREALLTELARLPGVRTEVETMAAEVEELQARSSRARMVLGGARQKLSNCDVLSEERKRRVKDRKRVAEEKAIFDELRLAFGKKGIQAMIIEAVIPEIEFEANGLLARMTDGRMNVRFETQRETLKGDTLETLDINIADDLGTRPYELFSGGEAFRVNFAIRVALSKLLARRAGAQLQMLVIDEGFGTQDAEGRERLVEAITSIQDDFSRILVITHIEELKDAFPVRIEVVKTADGSEFRVN